MDRFYNEARYFVFRWRHNCHAFCPSSPKIEEWREADARPTFSVELVRWKRATSDWVHRLILIVGLVRERFMGTCPNRVRGNLGTSHTWRGVLRVSADVYADRVNIAAKFRVIGVGNCEMAGPVPMSHKFMVAALMVHLI